MITESKIRDIVRQALMEEWDYDEDQWMFSEEFKNATYTGPDLEELGILEYGVYPEDFPHPMNSQEEPNLYTTVFGRDGKLTAMLEQAREYKYYVRGQLNKFQEEHPEMFDPANYEDIDDDAMPPFLYRTFEMVKTDKKGEDGKYIQEEQPVIKIWDPYCVWNYKQTFAEVMRKHMES